MSALSASDRTRVEAGIAAGEARTGAELAVAVAAASDSYAAFSVLWASSLALVAGGLALVAIPEIAAATLFAIIAALFVGLGLVLHLPPLRARLAPAKTRLAHARRLALVQFATLVQGRTQGRVGVLVFVSLAERHAEILVERGIADVVPATAWQGIVDRLVAEIAAGRLAEGLIGAIDAAATLLAPHFPRRAEDRNEIPDRLTEL